MREKLASLAGAFSRLASAPEFFQKMARRARGDAFSEKIQGRDLVGGSQRVLVQNLRFCDFCKFYKNLQKFNFLLNFAKSSILNFLLLGPRQPEPSGLGLKALARIFPAQELCVTSFSLSVNYTNITPNGYWCNFSFNLHLISEITDFAGPGPFGTWT